MKKIYYALTMLCLSLFSYGQGNEAAIKGALWAAPENLRAEATVMGYNESGDVVVLKKGTNKIICLADDPNKDGFSVSAYHKDLEPFMERGRQLRKEGMDREKVFEVREKEVKKGKLKIPNNSTLHILSGDSYDVEKDEVINAYMRWVIYIPYATEETTGLPLSPPGPGAPWLMDAGTHRAHIMVTPPKN